MMDYTISLKKRLYTCKKRWFLVICNDSIKDIKIKSHLSRWIGVFKRCLFKGSYRSELRFEEVKDLCCCERYLLCGISISFRKWPLSVSASGLNYFNFVWIPYILIFGSLFLIWSMWKSYLFVFEVFAAISNKLLESYIVVGNYWFRFMHYTCFLKVFCNWKSMS